MSVTTPLFTPACTLRLVGSRYLVQLPEPEAVSEGGILLPEQVRETVYDGVVLAGGPGRLLDNGRVWPMQAQVGDRVVVQRSAFVEYDPERRLGFVEDADLVAVIPGPDHCELRPCGDYVFVELDRLYQSVDGAAVQVRESGVLMASVALTGGEEWAEREGRLAYEESKWLWDVKWREEPEYFRHRKLHEYLDGLHPDVRRVAIRLAENEQNDRRFERQWVKREVALRGKLVDFGPGRVRRSGFRERTDVELDALTKARVDESPVHLDAAHVGVELSDGTRNLLAIQSRFIAAVEEG